MSRRLSILAVAILLAFVAVAVQSANVQFFRAGPLNASPINPRNNVVNASAPRGEILAADGSVLARSIPTGHGSGVYRRVYPFGRLTSAVVGYTSPSLPTVWGIEAEYNQYLISHKASPSSLAQLLAPSYVTDNVVLTLQPDLQRLASQALAGRDGAVVALDPRNGDVLAMYSNPNYDPAPLTSSNYQTAYSAWLKDNRKDADGFPPLGLVATQQTFPPGSTSKIVTTSAVVASDPKLLTKKYPVKSFIHLPDTEKTLQNFDGETCGGTIPNMIPPSCDTGFALVGLDLGAAKLSNEALAYGYDEVPPIDLPGAVASNFPTAEQFVNNLPGVAYSAIGQENVRTTALQNALVAAAVANGGVEMTPHLLDYVTGPTGKVVYRYQDSTWKTPLTAFQASEIVPWMENVVKFGTAYGYFPAADDVAAKTGTAQTGNGAQDTDDWMIAFAPATHPTVAVAVVLPFQVESATGATVAGPVISCVLQAALTIQSGAPGPTTCPSP